MENPDLENVSINWERSILIDDPIDEELLKKLMPKILAMRQESGAPITVGINSPGGSIATLDSLLSLLTGPTQDRKRSRIVTVVTNRAFSAAASLLALGAYSVALPSAKILYHDVRYGGMEDVTPSKARDAANALQDANDELAMKLAPRVIARLIWVYLDLAPNFDDLKTRFPSRYKKFSKIVDMFSPPVEGKHSLDIAAFFTSVYARLSPQNDSLIDSVMDQLGRWVAIVKLIGNANAYREKGSRKPGLLDGAKYLNKILSGKNTSKSFSDLEAELKLFVGLLSVRLAEPNSRDAVGFWQLIDDVSRDVKLIESMNDPKNQRAAKVLMLRHAFLFFGREIKEELNGKSEEEKDVILADAAPQARLLWCFCVLLCRELFKGEHVLPPNDAQLLGLVDEVAGGGAITSFREWKVNKIREAREAKAAESTTNNSKDSPKPV